MPRTARFALPLLLLHLFVVPAFAEPAPTAPAAPEAGPRYTLPPERLEKAVAFSRAKVVRYFAGALYGIALLAALLFLRVGPALRDRAEAIAPAPWLVVLVFAPLFFILIAVLDLPLAAWGHSLAVRYEQSIQGWRSWLLDWAKGELVGLVIATVATAIFFAVLRASPDRWWLWFWAALQPLVVFLVFLQPIVVDPLFFTFRPLAGSQPALVEKLEHVLARAKLKVARERIFEMDASTKRRSLNAYVTGIGASKRVVVWDTTLEKLDPEETLFVFGHELGHYVLGHIPRTMAVIAAVMLPLFWALARVAGAIVERHGASLGLRGLDDPAALPLFLVILSIVSFFAAPIGNAYGRWQEHEADVYGLEVIHGIVPEARRAAAGSFQRLGEIALAEPAPSAIARLWLYGHPPIAERKRFAWEYDPTESPRFFPR